MTKDQLRLRLRDNLKKMQTGGLAPRPIMHLNTDIGGDVPIRDSRTIQSWRNISPVEPMPYSELTTNITGQIPSSNLPSTSKNWNQKMTQSGAYDAIATAGSAIRNAIPNNNQTSTEDFANNMTNTAQGVVSAINPAIGALYAVGSAAGKAVRGDGTNTGGQIASGFINPSHSGFTAIQGLKDGSVSFGEALLMQDPIVGGILKARKAKEEEAERERKRLKEYEDQAREASRGFYAENPNFASGVRTQYYEKGGTLREKLTGRATGGKLVPLSSDSLEVRGKKHKDGGVKLRSLGVELEDGETISNIGGEDYVFSEKLGFAEKHKPLAKAKNIIEERSDRVSKNTIGLIERKEGGLKKQQETIRAMLGETDIDMFQTGGDLSRKERLIDNLQTIRGLDTVPYENTYVPQYRPEFMMSDLNIPVSTHVELGPTPETIWDIREREQLNKYRELSRETGGPLSRVLQAGSMMMDEARTAKDAIGRKLSQITASDYSDQGSFNSAFEKAKRDGKQVFRYNGKAYNTKSDLSPQQQLSRYGITDEQAEGRGLLSNRLYDTIKPSTYTDSKDVWEKMKDFARGRNRFENNQVIDDGWGNNNTGYDDPGSEDGWRMYLGLPQKNNTFGIADYRPSRSTDPNATYYKMNPEFEEQLLDSRNYYDTQNYSEGIMGTPARVLGNFQVQEGRDDEGDYISYYDRYDLDPNIPVIGKIDGSKIAGKPFEIYNRIYYDTDNEGNRVMRRKQTGGSLATKLAPYASNIYNMFRRLPEVPVPITDPTLRPNFVSYEGSRTEARNQARGLMRSLREGTPNRAVSDANSAAALATTISEVNKINEAENLANTDIRNRTAMINASIRARNNALMNQYERDKVSRIIAGQNLTADNIANVGDKYQLQQRDRNLFDLEGRRLDVLSRMYDRGVDREISDLTEREREFLGLNRKKKKKNQV